MGEENGDNDGMETEEFEDSEKSLSKHQETSTDQVYVQPTEDTANQSPDTSPQSNSMEVSDDIQRDFLVSKGVFRLYGVLWPISNVILPIFLNSD